jgi:hypothetical protein
VPVASKYQQHVADGMDEEQEEDDEVVTELMQQVVRVAVTWASLGPAVNQTALKKLQSSHLTAARHRTRWEGAQLPDEETNHCIPLSNFLDIVVLQFRQMETKVRYARVGHALFYSVALKSNGCMDFEGFQSIFLLATPKYTKREIGQLYANVVRSNGSDNFILEDFKRLVTRLMSTGVIFSLPDPSVTPAKAAIIGCISKAWASFRVFFDHFFEYLEHGDNKRDFECGQTLKTLRFLMEAEMSKPNKFDIRASRLVSLYRGILHVTLSHQAAWLLAKNDTPAPVLDVELRVLHRIIFQRHQMLLTGASGVDAWLKHLLATSTEVFFSDKPKEEDVGKLSIFARPAKKLGALKPNERPNKPKRAQLGPSSTGRTARIQKQFPKRY